MGICASCASVDAIPPSANVRNLCSKENTSELVVEEHQVVDEVIAVKNEKPHCNYHATKWARRRAMWTAYFQDRGEAVCPICLDAVINRKTFRIARFTFSGQRGRVPVCFSCKESWESIGHQNFT